MPRSNSPVEATDPATSADAMLASCFPDGVPRLSAYAQTRQSVRAAEIAYKKRRQLQLGPHLRLQFENARTLRYQINESLYAERMAADANAHEEAERYRHLLPCGADLRATLFIEIPDALVRQCLLPPLNAAAQAIYLETPRAERIVALANEDLADRHVSRPSATHFLRFPLSKAFVRALAAGGPLIVGCAHDDHGCNEAVSDDLFAQLLGDVDLSAFEPTIATDGTSRARVAEHPHAGGD